MMQRYAFSLLAIRPGRDECEHEVGIVRAESPTDAKEHVENVFSRCYPPTEGWTLHAKVAGPLDAED